MMILLSLTGALARTSILLSYLSQSSVIFLCMRHKVPREEANPTLIDAVRYQISCNCCFLGSASIQNLEQSVPKVWVLSAPKSVCTMWEASSPTIAWGLSWCQGSNCFLWHQESSDDRCGCQFLMRWCGQAVSPSWDGVSERVMTCRQ